MSSSSSSSSSSSPFHMSREEFNLFHSIDLKLYALLVMTLVRDPAESMQVMALWVWLEQKGLRDAVKGILSLPDFLVNELADEASKFVSLAASSKLSALCRSHIPLTHSLLIHTPPPLLLPSTSLTVALDLSRIADQLCSRLNVASVPPDSRTMFVTFSKGYPVRDYEVREFFSRAYGDSCVESLHMQEVSRPGEQSLFARIVFKMASTIDLILNGLSKAKFTINGKHVWMRRFVPKKHPKPQHSDDSLPEAHHRDPLPDLPASLFDFD